MRHFRSIDGGGWTIVAKNISPMHITCSSLVPNPPFRHVWTRAQVNADFNLQFKVTITSGENGQLVGKLHLHTTCFTRHRSQPTTGTRNTQTHTRQTHNLQVVVVVFQSTTLLLSRSNKTAQRLKETQPKIMGKMEETPACVDKQRKTNPCPNWNYYTQVAILSTRSLTQHFFGKSPGTIER